MHSVEGLKRASVSMLYKQTNGWEKLYTTEGTEITNTITPLYNGLPSLQLAYSTASFMTPFGFIKTFCLWFLYYLPFLFVPPPHTFISLSSSTVLGLISAIFLIISLLPWPFSFPYIHQDKNPSPKWTIVSPFPYIIVWTVFLPKFMLKS